jgi:hypothetical protein
MGCDIHFYVEKWTSSNNYEGPKDLSEDREQKLNEVLEDYSTHFRWVSADNWEEDDDGWLVPYNSEFYNGRNYGLFSILADVRGNEEPIDNPRGIPDDASYGYKYMCDRWDGDAHSHSYFTLEELLKVDWIKYDEYCVSEFLETIEDMKKIDEDPSMVRCCFFFDN